MTDGWRRALRDTLGPFFLNPEELLICCRFRLSRHRLLFVGGVKIEINATHGLILLIHLTEDDRQLIIQCDPVPHALPARFIRTNGFCQ